MQVRVLHAPPEELIATPLRRLGEGVGKVVYASPHWVVKRERSPSEVVAIVVLWNILRKVKRLFPKHIADKMFTGPSKQIRFFRVLVQAGMLVIPKSIWFTRRIEHAWKLYHKRNVRGERLAEEHLTGTVVRTRAGGFDSPRIRCICGTRSSRPCLATVRGSAHRRMRVLREASGTDHESCPDFAGTTSVMRRPSRPV